MQNLRRLIPLLAVLVATAPLSAQTTLGLRTGLGRASLSFDDDGQFATKARSGLAIGMDVGLPISDAIDLRLGGTYAPKGGGAAVGGGRVDLALDFLQFSALGRAGTPGPVSAGILFGPWAAFRLNCDLSAEGGGVTVSQSCEGDFDIKTTDFGVTGGAGVDVSLRSGLGLGVDLLYSLGLASIDDDSTKTGFFAVQAGVVFTVG